MVTICADELSSKPYKTYFGEDAINKFLNYLIKESVNIVLK